MTQLQIFTNVEFGEIRGLNIDGKPYAVANDVLKILGYAKRGWRTTLSRKCKYVKKCKCSTKGGKQLVNVIPEDDVYRLIQCCQTKTEQFKASLVTNLISEGLLKDDCKILISRAEIEFLDQLEQALQPFNIKGIRQYSILSYRIDYYIPSLNVAIEYDENNHKNYSYERQEGRQQEIEKELNCRFIRVSDKNTNIYNIGFIIKNIFNI